MSHVSGNDPGHLLEMDIARVGSLIERRQLSPVELIREVLHRINTLEPVLRSFITVLDDQALADARTAEAEISSGRYRGPLHGIPICLKDVFFTRGVRTTAGTRAWRDFVPDYNAAIVDRLQAAGAVIVGKNNMDELAIGASNNNPHYGQARNPWNLEYAPGGSSGGSAAAVAAGMAFGAIGGDSGGSLRIPAAHNNLVGMKPTRGLVSRYGVFTGSWTLDCSGPLTRTVLDNAILLQCLVGQDPRDPASIRAPSWHALQCAEYADLRGVRVGIPDDFFFEDLTADVAAATTSAIDVLISLGAEAVPISLPSARHSASAGAIISWSEFAVSQELLIREQGALLGAELAALLSASSMHLATHYIKAQQASAVIAREYQAAWSTADVVLTPVTAGLPPRVGVFSISPKVVFTRTANLTGEPAVAVPCGVGREGVPIGFQIQARRLNELTAYRVAHVYERATDWHLRRPAQLRWDSTPDQRQSDVREDA